MVRKTEYIIYKAENHLGDRYIGCTQSSLNSRKANHIYHAANNPTSKLHHSIAKHGADKFNWLVIDTAENQEEALTKEKHYIDHYLSFYSLNGNRGGQGLSGRKHSDETKLKMSQAKLGIPKSESHKKALSDAAKKRKVHGMAKLTPSKVREIRRLLVEFTFTHQELADIFNVHSSTISAIKTRRTWKNVS